MSTVTTYLPEILLLVGGALCVAADRMFAGRCVQPLRAAMAISISSASCVGAAAMVVANLAGLAGVEATAVVAIVLLTGFASLLSRESDFTRNPGEFHLLLMVAAAGLCMLVRATDLLSAFVALETASLSLYCLAGFNKSSPSSAEASFKYFLYGVVAAAFLLYGFSLLYGSAGSLEIKDVAASLLPDAEAGDGRLPALSLAAIALVVVGYGYKMAAAPFYQWAPDTYQGAPMPAVFVISTASKIAGVLFFGHLFGPALVEASGMDGLRLILGVVAGLSIIFGNVGAIRQQSVRRMLAYSAVAHAGYMTVGFACWPESGLSILAYYAVTYGLATMGALGVTAVVERRTGGDTLDHFAGLASRSRGLALLLGVFVLSLAGIPPLAGFTAKFVLFTAAYGTGQPGALFLVALGLAGSSVAFYYYLQILKAAFIRVPRADQTTSLRCRSVATLAVLVALAGGVVIMGILPSF